MAFSYNIEDKKFEVTKLNWKAVEDSIGNLNNNLATWHSVEDSGIQNTGRTDPNGRPIYKRTFTRVEFTPRGKRVIETKPYEGVGRGGDFRNDDLIKRIVTEVEDLQETVNQWNEDNSADNIAANNLANQLIAEGKEEIREMQNTNKQYQNVVNQAKRTNGGDYLQNFNALLKQKGFDQLDDETANNLKESFKDFYRNTKLEKWKSPLKEGETGVPYGRFDSEYYGKTYLTPRTNWKNAQASEDLDVTERFGSEENYYLYHYLSRGRKAGNRGNAPQVYKDSAQYAETAPTTQEIQAARDKQLGVSLEKVAGSDEESYSERILKNPKISAAWSVAKDGDSYWKDLAKENYLNVENPDDFVALFRLSERPKDKEAIQELVDEEYITEAEDKLIATAGVQALSDTSKFGALAQDVLKQTVDAMKAAKAKENQLAFYRGFSGVDEILSINDSLTNSLLGDAGIGGVLSFTGNKENMEESYKEGFEKITGISRNISNYNWQQWFDKTLKDRYDDDLELGYTKGEATEKLKIEKEFAQKFYDDYLKVRFDTSRSMDEFVEYLDVRQEEQNPFQTESTINKISRDANRTADKIVDLLQGEADRNFDYKFYFNPQDETTNKSRESEYAAQKAEVDAAWDQAKKNPNKLISPDAPELGTWAQQAYRFGRDLNNQEEFAKMHYQIIGKANKFDAAKDIFSPDIVSDLIDRRIISQAKGTLENDKYSATFGTFTTPEEFADELLEGVDPANSEKIKEILEDLGLEDFQGTVEELKGYIIDNLSVNSAVDMRENIKYLNENRKKPTQKNLGVTYIERDEDYKPEELTGQSEFYKTFQKAGYKGTEQEFYDEFMPDANQEDLNLLSAAGRDEAFKFDFGDYSDPFEAYGSVTGFLGGDDEDEDTEEENKKKEPGFFDLSLDIDDDDDSDYKSSRGKSILGDFTSGFKFFKN